VSEARFQKIVEAWIVAQDTKTDAPDHNPNNWAIQLSVRWHLSNKPEKLWRLICAVLERDVSDEVLMMVACGPLEDLLSSWGQDYIERVEELAASDARFRRILRAVYRRSMALDVWSKLQALVVADTESSDTSQPH
jgi:hypothetical protein